MCEQLNLNRIHPLYFENSFNSNHFKFKRIRHALKFEIQNKTGLTVTQMSIPAVFTKELLKHSTGFKFASDLILLDVICGY